MFHTDPGHGWLQVEKSELKELGIARDISGFSYQKGNNVYLEEDADASHYLRAMESRGVKLKIQTVHKENSPIRNYRSYRG